VKSHRKELWFETPGRRAFLNITPQVEATLKEKASRSSNRPDGRGVMPSCA
jgi:hypothetical protein